MKHARSLAIVLAALAAPLFPQNLRAEAEVSFAYFQEALSPFGEWLEVADYGLCWRPTGVAEDWAPYTDGYWAYTDAGWTWVSYEDWGGITYHYGRWIHLVEEGWVWVPEYDWGPAWVSWRSNDDYVGWAPLPPEARWEENTGFSTWVDTSYDIGPDHYRFCHTRDFGAPVLAPILLPCERNVTIIVNTVNITNITFNRHHSQVFCGGPNFGRINQHVHRPIPAMRLHCEDRDVRGPHGNRTPQIVRGNQIALYAPKVKRPPDLKALPITPRRVVGADKVNRGWSRVPDLAAQQQIKQRLQQQSAGLNPRTAPARPVEPADLAGVPPKADPTARPPTALVRERSGPARNPGQPGRLATEAKPVAQPASPAINPPAIAERVAAPVNPPPNVTRPVAARPAVHPTVPNTIPPPQSRPEPARPPQVAAPVVDARAAEAERGRAQQQQQENAQRSAIARQQAESAQRQVEQQQSAQRAAEVRNQETQARRQQAEAASRQHENAQRAQRESETRQQVIQQQQSAQRATEVRQQAVQQQQAAQRASQNRQQAVQQQQATQRATELRIQQVQQAAVARQRDESVQRANEARQQQTRQAPPQREYLAPPSRPAQQEQPRPAPAQRKDGDDDTKRQRSGR